MVAETQRTLQEIRAELDQACQHLKECNLLYGEQRLDHGLPTDRAWALIPACQALAEMVSILADLETRVEVLETRGGR